MVVRPKMSSDAMAEINAIESIECGKEAAKHFGIAKDYTNLNHGSFGTFPLEIKNVMRSFQDQCEARPDWFIRYEYPRRLDDAREAVAKVLNAPVETCVFVPNATTGVNTVLRNLVYQPGDVIIYFATIYGACHKTIEYLMETTPVEARKVEYTYPCEDEEMLAAFERTIEEIKSSGKTPKLAIFDTIASMPGVRMPFEALTRSCATHKILSLIDGAHSIGQIPLDLTTLNPDFYVSNCHKWLHVPRGCAVFYVPTRNQHLMRSTLPTSHGFVPEDTGEGITNPLPPSKKSEFVNNFEFVGTVDNAPYLCVPAAIAWRSKVTYGELRGEEAIVKYNIDLAREAGRIVSGMLGTEVMDNSTHSLTQCCFANVRLPLEHEKDTAMEKALWVNKTLLEEFNTFMAIVLHNEKFWVRLSAQVYLTTEEFEWAGKVLKGVCERAERGEWKS